MELRQLRYFLGILEHANFNRAAAALHVTQPALSKSMRALEDELGVELLERGAHGVVPTPYGRVLQGSARVALNELRRAVEEIDALASRGSGRIIVGGGVVLRHVVPRVCARLASARDGLEVVIVEQLRAQAIAAIDRGEIDLALVGAVDGERLPEGLVQAPIGRDQVVVVAHRTHPLCGAAAITLDDLAREPWVMPGNGEQERLELVRALDAAGLPAPQVAFETGSTALMARLLAHQPLLSYLPSLLLQDDPTFAELRALRVPFAWPERRVVVVHRAASADRAGVARFLAAIKSVMRDLELERDGVQVLPAA